jgi:hypothetical protein
MSLNSQKYGFGIRDQEKTYSGSRGQKGTGSRIRIHNNVWQLRGLTEFLEDILNTGENKCAAGFALLNLPKGKSLGRSKPETNSSNEQAH